VPGVTVEMVVIESQRTDLFVIEEVAHRLAQPLDVALMRFLIAFR
jgi:hypothetical protein